MRTITYGVFDALTDDLIEGGFFDVAAAEAAMTAYTEETGRSAYVMRQSRG